MSDEDRQLLIRHLNASTDEEAIANADEVELRAIREGAAVIESGLHDERIVGSLRELESIELDEGQEDAENENQEAPRDIGWMELAAAEEREAGAVAEEIQRRFLLLENAYPFSIKGNNLIHRKSETGFYEFCLAASMLTNYSREPWNQLPRSFERFAKDVLATWAGPAASGWQTGWPGRMEAGLPDDLSELWGQIHSATQEWKWQPGASDLPPNADDHQKDLGVDLLVWKRLQDERIGNLFFAGQCACGKDALAGNKKGDLDKAWLRKWFGTLSDVEFVPCLFLPRCLGGTARAVRVRSGVLWFDRIRLLLAASANPDLVVQSALRSYHELSEIVINGS